MRQRLAPLDGSIHTFARHGASAQVEGNTAEAFKLALQLGATGFSASLWSTADEVAVVHRKASVGRGLRRHAIAGLTLAELPPQVLSLHDLYDLIGPDTSLSLELGGPTAFQAALNETRRQDNGAEERLWLCSPNRDQLAAWRALTSAKLVNTTTLARAGMSQEFLAAELRNNDIDGLLLPHHEWSPGLVAVMHRFERYGLGWGAEHEREMAKLIDSGIDGFYSRHVDRMVAVTAEFTPGQN